MASYVMYTLGYDLIVASCGIAIDLRSLLVDWVRWGNWGRWGVLFSLTGWYLVSWLRLEERIGSWAGN